MGELDHDVNMRSAASLLVQAARLQMAAAAQLTHDSSLSSPTDDRPVTAELTPREQEVLDLLGRGLSNRRISTELDIAESTVRAHLHAIFSKLGATQRTEAVVLAIHAGLLSFEP